MIIEERDYMSEMFKEISDGENRIRSYEKLIGMMGDLKKKKPLPSPKSKYHN